MSPSHIIYDRTGRIGAPRISGPSKISLHRRTCTYRRVSHLSTSTPIPMRLGHEVPATMVTRGRFRARRDPVHIPVLSRTRERRMMSCGMWRCLVVKGDSCRLSIKMVTRPWCRRNWHRRSRRKRWGCTIRAWWQDGLEFLPY
jgi:hypothetical protein